MSKIPFKKLASAVAVSAALGGVGVTHAIEQAEPANAWLIPLAQYSTTDNTNTLVGLTVPDQTVGNLAGSGECANPQSNTSNSYTIHWYFFNTRSVHQADGTLTATAEDFVPFDWRGIATSSSGVQAKTDGVYGYLVFSDNDAIGGGAANQCFFADAIWIRGNWESAAYLPAMGLQDTADAASGLVSSVDDVTYSGGEPSNVNPIRSGMTLNDIDTVSEIVFFDMRYFLDDTSTPTGSTDLVFWFPTNGTTDQPRTNVPIDVYDTGENAGSFNIDLPDELNIIDATTIGWTDWTQDGSLPGGTPAGASKGPLEGNKQGFIRFDMPELDWVAGTNYDSTSTVGAGGVFFSLVGLTSTGNPQQIQTILAHERGIGSSL